MTITANLADGRVLNFPDGTDPQVIQATVKRMIAESQPVQAAQPQQVAQQPQLPVEEAGFLDQALGGLENVASLASGIVAEPLAGLAGIGAQIGEATGLADEGAAKRTIEATREALTFQPKTEAGQSQQQAIGQALAPVAEVLTGAEKALGDTAFELTGSPAIAAAAKSLPTAALELLGFKGAKRLTSPTGVPTSRQVKKATIESAPEIEQLKDVSRQVYNEIDASGVRVTEKSVGDLISGIDKSTRSAGLDPRTTPRAAGALDVIKDDLGSAQSLTEIDRLRTVAQRVAANLDPSEKALGNIMIDEIDSFLDNANSKNFVKGTETSTQTAKKFKAARKLWGRAKRAELIGEAIKEGSRHASGVENGTRIELRKILGSEKKKKFFPESELSAIRGVVEGNFAQNATKLVGKLGISDNNFLNALAGSGAGAVVGGGIGGFAVPVIGTVAREISKKVTKNRAKFVENMVSAGSDAEKITKAYLSSVPKKRRSVSDLADLLSDPNIDLDILEDIANKTIQEALEIAKGKRSINLAAAATTGALAQQKVSQEADKQAQ